MRITPLSLSADYSRERIRKAAILLASLAIGLPTAIVLVRIAVRASLLFYLAYNEGWNAYHAQSAISGGALYPPADGWVANNYPPLSFYLVGSLGTIVGDNILAGRYIAFVAFLLVVICTYMTARGLGAMRAAAAFAAAATAATLLLVGELYAGINDPQMLAHALAMVGLAVFVSPRLRRWPAGLGGGALIAASIFVKHMLVALPCVLFVSCVFFRRDRVVPLVAGAVAVAASLGIWIATSFGAPFFDQLLAPRVYSTSHMITELAEIVQPTLAMLAAGVFLWAAFRLEFATALAAFMTLLGYGAALFYLSAAGVGYSASFEGIIGGGLALSLLLTRLGLGPTLGTLGIVVFQLALYFALALERHHLSPTRTLAPEQALVQETAADIAFIRQRPGPALCEAISLCYWAGKPFVLDPFNANRFFATGKAAEATLLDQVRARSFSSIELLFRRKSPDAFGLHFSAAFDQALRENYELARRSSIGAIYVPKP